MGWAWSVIGNIAKLYKSLSYVQYPEWRMHCLFSWFSLITLVRVMHILTIVYITAIFDTCICINLNLLCGNEGQI